MALLALPIGLTLAAALAQSGIGNLRRVEHLSELYGRLLQTRDQEIQREFRPGWSVYSPLTALATAMSERQELIAPVAALDPFAGSLDLRSEEHTSELQSLMRISYAVFCLKKKKNIYKVRK